MESVVTELKTKGVNVVDNNAEIVLLAFDRTLDYQKMTIANEHMVNGAIYIATHPDYTCPTKGISIPDLGSIMQMFKYSSDRQADFITGKPYKILADYIMKRLNLKPEQVTMVGDRLMTDIAFGVNSGINSVLVLTGETDLEMANESDIKADITIDNIDILKEYI